MGPDTEPDNSIAEAVQAGPDRQWWQALRRTVLRVLDTLEAAAQSDPALRADVQRLFLAPAPDQAEPHPPGSASSNGHPADSESSSGATLPQDSEPSAEKPAGAASEGVEDGAVAPPAPAAVQPRRFTPAAFPMSGPSIVETPAPPAAAAVAAGPIYPQRWAFEFDPARITKSCRLKAAACHWQSTRSRKLDEGEDVSAGDRELVSRAAASDIYLWMVSPNRWRERSEAGFTIVAGCYDALADAVELMALADELRVEQESSMKLLAEAQSAVRVAVEDYGSTRRDEDQETTFYWLRQQTDLRRIYVEHLQLDNPAPPDNHADLRRRIADVRTRVEAVRHRGRNAERALRKIRYHVSKILNRRTGEPPLQSDDGDLASMNGAAKELLEQGVQPSDLRLRELLLPIYERLAEIGAESLDRAAPALCRVMESIGQYVDEQAANQELQEQSSAVLREDPLVGRARELVAGRNAVLIGGVPSELHRARLEQGLGLASLNWIRIEHHESFDAAAMAIQRPGVGLVLLMTRWRSHRDGPAARELCRRLEIPLVELPAGYNLRQVAHCITEQFCA